MKNFFIFDGKSSLDYGIRIESYPDVSIPERIYESYEVPGRSGNMIFDTGAYRNVTQLYNCWYKPLKQADFATSYSLIQHITRWLLGPKGYRELEDSYFPWLFRKAIYAGPADISSFFAKYGRITLEFNCMPQKWLKSGQNPISVESGQQIFNDGETALPLIQISGSGEGTLGVGNSTVQLSEIPDSGVTIDAETQNIYSGSKNYNSIATISGGFPTLPNGATGITFSGGITGVTIIPRWWVL